MRLRVISLLVILAAVVASAQTRTPTPTPPPASPVDTSTVERILRGDEAVDAGQGFTYDPAGRRDPFRSLLAAQPSKEVGVRPPGVRGIGVEELKLQGILRLPDGWVAMVQGTDNASYLIRAGTVLYDGTVDKVEPDRVVFRLQIADPKSLKPYREVVRMLQ
jgi:type IV pilus assembly protein PilP